jgi:hypothetical protein
MILQKQWGRAIVSMHKAASDLSRLRSNLKSLHVSAQLDTQNASVGGADASREEAKERELLARMNQIDIYLCTANMLYAPLAVNQCIFVTSCACTRWQALLTLAKSRCRP